MNGERMVDPMDAVKNTELENFLYYSVLFGQIVKLVLYFFFSNISPSTKFHQNLKKKPIFKIFAIFQFQKKTFKKKRRKISMQYYSAFYNYKTYFLVLTH